MSGGYQMSGGGNPLLGVPVIRCQSCGALNRTGKLPWSAMSRYQRRWLLIGAAYRALMVGLIFSVGVGFFVWLVIGSDSFDRTLAPWIVSILFGEILSFIYSWRLYKRAIPRIEQATEDQDWDSAPQII
jgi:hypothetical protein